MTGLCAMALAAVLVQPPAHIDGRATWYDNGRGIYASAGPALRQALGPGWRGKHVTVCRYTACVRVQLTGWCQCHKGHADERLIDLSRSAFSRLAPPWRGVIRVRVRM